MKRILLSSILFTQALLSDNITQLSSIESNFQQSITNEQNSKIIYSGKMYATQKENQALWEYQTPIVKKIYYKKGNIVIIEPELEQAIFAKLTKVPNVLQLLNSAKKTSKNELITTFNKIDYTITLENQTIKTISYVDEIQNHVTITFDKQKTNREIKSEVFVYNIPEDYDILQQ